MNILRLESHTIKRTIEPLVLRGGAVRRTVLALGHFVSKDGYTVTFVRVGVQFRYGNGWCWSLREGVSIPLRMLGEVAAWLTDCARALPSREGR